MAAEDVVARTLAGHRTAVAEVAAARRKLLVAPADSIGRAEVRRRRVEEAAELHMVGEREHRKVDEEERRTAEEEEAAELHKAGGMGHRRVGQAAARRTAEEEGVAGSTPLAGEAAGHKAGTRNKTSQESRSRNVQPL